jgi:hypothetical protein
VCIVCRGPALGEWRLCFACRVVARRLGLPLAPVLPARLCPLPSPLYTVLLGYKESPVSEARSRYGAIVRGVFADFLRARGDELRALLRGPADVVSVVPSTNRPGPAPLARIEGLACDVVEAQTPARWVPSLLCRGGGPGGPPPVAHMRADPSAFTSAAAHRPAVRGARVLLLDDTYVSGARSQSAAAALSRAGARSVTIAPAGRVLRPERFGAHAEFLRRHAR